MDILDEMDLPLANPMEELETISRNMFKPLFDPSCFELRSETKDKGIDYNVELKHEKRHTNFRFSIQLKATDSRASNVDGSISLQLYTSNINYLLNGSGVAYYVLYSKEQDKFWFKDLSQFVKELNEKDPDWMKQKSHVLRFREELTKTSVEGMYRESLQRGRLQRLMNEKLSLKTASLAKGDKILINERLEVTDDAEIRKLVEHEGFLLINEGHWLKVLTLHRQASINVASTPIYNLVLGMASYYNGQYVDSLGHIRKASRPVGGLPERLRVTRKYFEVISKRAIGILNEDQYQEQIQQLESEEGVGFYASLETAIEKYRAAIGKGREDVAFNILVKDIDFILNHPKADGNVKLMAQCELLLYEGSRNNTLYFKGVSELNILESSVGPDLEARVSFVRDFFNLKEQWTEKFKIIIQKAKSENNFFAFHFANLNYVKVIYEQLVYSTIVQVEHKIPQLNKAEEGDVSHILTDLVERLEDTHIFYKQIGHVENTCAVLSTIYQIQHFARQYTNAAITLSELENIVEIYDLEKSRAKIQSLKNGGSTHETLQKLIDEILKDQEIAKKDWEEKVEEMRKMDNDDLKANTSNDSYEIHLFPIGHFRFKKSDKNKAYAILGISKGEVASQFDYMFEEGIIPVANILNYPLAAEGYGRGKSDGDTKSSWDNVFRVRKAFFESGFIRITDVFG